MGFGKSFIVASRDCCAAWEPRATSKRGERLFERVKGDLACAGATRPSADVATFGAALRLQVFQLARLCSRGFAFQFCFHIDVPFLPGFRTHLSR